MMSALRSGQQIMFQGLYPRYTSPYKFYQFWLNVSDADAEKYIKIFTFLNKEEIEALVAEQASDPGRRPLQKRLALEITTMVHSAEDAQNAIDASAILFGGGGADALRKLDERTLLDVFEAVPSFEIDGALLDGNTRLADILVEKAPVFPSKAEMRKLVQQGGFYINKEKVTDPMAVATADMLIDGKYIIVQKGKKQYFLLKVNG